MSDYPRGSSERSPSSPFFLDRIAAYTIFSYCVVGLCLTLLYLQRDFVRVQDMGAVGPLGYLGRRWSVHLRYLFMIAAYGWTCLGLIRNRRWAIPLLTFLESSDLVGYLHSMYLYGLVGSAFGAAYAFARLIGWLGPETEDRFALGQD